MKNKSLKIAMLAFGILSMAAVLAFAKIVRPGLKKKPHGYVIAPISGVASDQAWAAVKSKLTKWDKQLYLIQTYKEGNVLQTTGTMNEMFLDNPLSTTNQAAKQVKFSGCAVQIGVNIFEANTEADGTGQPNYPHSHVIQSIKNSEELVKDVEGLLDPAPTSPAGK